MFPSYIKRQPILWKYIPWLKRLQGVTIGTVILFQPEIYDNLLTEHPNPENIAIRLHEEFHRNSVIKIGLLKFGFAYMFKPQFRFHEELSANQAGFTFLKKTNVQVDLKRKAYILSSWLYFWPVSYEYALNQVKKAWEDA